MAVRAGGYASFGVLSFHLAVRHIVPTAVIPLIYAAAMATDAAAAVATGWLYDHIGHRSLVMVPILSAATLALAFQTSAELATAGVLLWGAAPLMACSRPDSVPRPSSARP